MSNHQTAIGRWTQKGCKRKWKNLHNLHVLTEYFRSIECKQTSYSTVCVCVCTQYIMIQGSCIWDIQYRFSCLTTEIFGRGFWFMGNILKKLVVQVFPLVYRCDFGICWQPQKKKTKILIYCSHKIHTYMCVSLFVYMCMWVYYICVYICVHMYVCIAIESVPINLPNN